MPCEVVHHQARRAGRDSRSTAIPRRFSERRVSPRQNQPFPRAIAGSEIPHDVLPSGKLLKLQFDQRVFSATRLTELVESPQMVHTAKNNLAPKGGNFSFKTKDVGKLLVRFASFSVKLFFFFLSNRVMELSHGMATLLPVL